MFERRPYNQANHTGFHDNNGITSIDSGKDENQERNLFLFIALHIPLAILCYHVEAVSVAHEILVFLVGLWALFLRPRNDKLLLLTVAYIVGAEVLWRRTGAASTVAWEFGKYSVILLLSCSMLFRPRKIALPLLMLLYMLFLLPSIAMVWNEDMDLLRYRVIGTLAGPLGLVVCSIYFYNMHISDRDMKRLMMVMLAPIIGVLIYAMYNTYLHRDILHFGKSANKITSGGGGSNQVANTLGLGALICWLLLNTYKLRRISFIIITGLFLVLSIQMLLTFSRGGPFSFGLAAIVTIPLLLKGKTSKVKNLFLFAGVIILIGYIVWPKINEATGGMAWERFSNLSSSRQDLAAAELEIWKNHFIFGVGPGFARDDVEKYMGVELQAHVEFTRMLAEHGIFGLFSLIILFYAAWENFICANSGKGRVWFAAFIVFTFSYMAQSATRQIAPGFLFGLTWAKIYLTDLSPNKNSILESESLSHRKPDRGR